VGKAVAFVSWGSEGGVRAVEQWRAILSNFSMIDVRQQVALSTFYDYEEGQLRAGDRRQAQLDALFDQLVEAAVRLRRG
jgi:NAD(P)H-dependent FMN reductase